MLLDIAGPQPSTYINATFIEGYDHSEQFIITQDPMEDSIGDFWRMISEQSINTIVMVSEVRFFKFRFCWFIPSKTSVQALDQ